MIEYLGKPNEENMDIERIVGHLQGMVTSLEEHIERLDHRINGTFDKIGDHIKDGDYYRDKIIRLETSFKTIKEEKLNTIKASQWRIGLIASGIPTLIIIVLKAIEILYK